MVLACEIYHSFVIAEKCLSSEIFTRSAQNFPPIKHLRLIFQSENKGLVLFHFYGYFFCCKGRFV